MLVLALAGPLWIAAGFYYGFDLLGRTMLGLLLITAGLALAAWRYAHHKGLAVGGLALAVVGMLVFVGPGLFGFGSLANVASHIFTLGLVGVVAGRAIEGTVWIRAGAAASAVGVVLWLIADANGGGAWQFGNLAAGIGMTWLAWKGD